jgi:hypothetical protein
LIWEKQWQTRKLSSSFFSLFSCCFGGTEGSVKNLDIIDIFDSVLTRLKSSWTQLYGSAIQIMHKAKAQIEFCVFAHVMCVCVCVCVCARRYFVEEPIAIIDTELEIWVP